MRRRNKSWKVDLLLWSLILLALGVFGGACYGALRILTGLPVWAIILISVVVAVVGFSVFVWTHGTNGFDGIYGEPPGVLLSGRQRKVPTDSAKKD